MNIRRSIAVAQTCPIPGNVQANLSEHLRLAERAALQGAELVIFPELSLTGYELHLCHDLAFSENDRQLMPLQQLATERNIAVIVGAPVRVGTVLHIGAFILRPNGTIQIYTKHRLGTFPPEAACDSCNGSVPPSEKSVFMAGTLNPLVEMGATIAAVAVCADIGDPAHAAQAANRGANAYLASMFVIPSDYASETTKLSRYAQQHHMLTALANFGASSGNLRSAGCSSIWSPTGKLLVKLAEHGAGIAVVHQTDEDYRTYSEMV